LRDRAPRVLLNPLVEIKKRPSQSEGECLTNTTLARSHEAHQAYGSNTSSRSLVRISRVEH
jgi:hypothetical protein